MDKLLIANRGEIAVRIERTAREMGITSIAVYISGEEGLPHVQQADCGVSLGIGTLHETYLNQEKLIAVALEKGADAIHPGYGFLSENADFAAACRQAGITFVGPEADAIRLMGNKLEAQRTVADAGVRLLEQYKGTQEQLTARKEELPYPALIKAASGGGGKGMRVVQKAEELDEKLKTTAREAQSYFGDETVFIEPYLENPRHIEVQVMGDTHGNHIHLFERECSIQRRHQKIIEEAPSVSLSGNQRKQITKAAVAIARRIGYYNAGTVEFLMDKTGRFYFLEMNTRIQVEHPATEFVTGVDIVREQIRIAEGLPLSVKQDDLVLNGHAIEARIYAENPEQDFMPSPGRLVAFDVADMPGVRVDAGISPGNNVRADFDPMIAKVIAHAPDRPEAAKKLARFLKNAAIGGIHTNRKYLQAVLNDPHYLENRISTTFIQKRHDHICSHSTPTLSMADKQFAVAAYAVMQAKGNGHPNRGGYWRLRNHWKLALNESTYSVSLQIAETQLLIELEGASFTVENVQVHGNMVSFRLHGEYCRTRLYQQPSGILLFLRNGAALSVRRMMPRSDKKQKQEAGQKTRLEQVKAPMFGKVLDIRVREDSTVKAGETLLVLEAMKMENSIQASHDLLVRRINVQKGDQVQDGQVLIEAE